MTSKADMGVTDLVITNVGPQVNIIIATLVRFYNSIPCQNAVTIFSRFAPDNVVSRAGR